MTTIWHNPRCSKSRATLALIEEAGITPAIRRYLDDAPSESEIREVLALLNIPAEKLIRKGEALFKELGLKDADEDTLIKAMAEHPKLVERPVVIKDGKATLGRPPESVLDIL
ncbi:arsenate reductase (glutaredoxin) [Profundibacter amoris]|uniref:Arsenate reductase n=1 Tax=Profundibacter amoris TaxID=2171755 RepID=A0A347UIM1_9RHOB|nr:arsenate reductase (glutaredoxin) [Profundibacter amoris]AXX98699.1 arsenate reductase (glutaredoxin) [Profundibacter amoris]